VDFVYGIADATAKASGLTSLWKTRDTVDRKRMEAETKVLTLLMEQLSKTWRGVIGQYP